MSDKLWTESDNHLARVFDEAEKSARGLRCVITQRDHPCHLHSEPGPEMWREDTDGTEHPVTDAMREQWERDSAFVVCEVYVGTCHTAGCDPATRGGHQA